MDKSYQFEVSVCITTFNMERYIERALNSVLIQKTDFDFEIIISDDASEDSTTAILEAFRKKYPGKIIVLKAIKNKGLIENFITGLKAAQGKYLATLDADDYWIDDLKLQKQVDILNDKSDIGFVYTNYYNETEISGMRSIGLPSVHKYPESDAFFQMLTSSFIHMSMPCFRQDLLTEVALDDFVRLKFVAPDMSFFLGFAIVSKGMYLPDITTVYTIRKGSMSHGTDFEKRMLNYKRVYDIGNYYIERNKVPQKIIAKRNFNFNLKLLLIAWETRNFNKVREYAQPLKANDFLRFNKKAWYIYHASKNKFLFKIVKPWVLRKRA